MSNKRNARRGGQRVRSEVARKPVLTTKVRTAAFAAIPQERSRKEQERAWEKAAKIARAQLIRRVRLRHPSKIRNPRTNPWIARHAHDS